MPAWALENTPSQPLLGAAPVIAAERRQVAPEDMSKDRTNEFMSICKSIGQPGQVCSFFKFLFLKMEFKIFVEDAFRTYSFSDNFEHFSSFYFSRFSISVCKVRVKARENEPWFLVKFQNSKDCSFRTLIY